MQSGDPGQQVDKNAFSLRFRLAIKPIGLMNTYSAKYGLVTGESISHYAMLLGHSD